MVKGIFLRRKSRRLAEVEIDGCVYEAYMSNGSEIGFLTPGSVCYLREAENIRRTAYDFYSIYDADTLVCVDAKEPLRVAGKWLPERLEEELNIERLKFYGDSRFSTLLSLGDYKMMIQVMGTSLVNERKAYLPEIPSRILNQRLDDLIIGKDLWDNIRLLLVTCRDDADYFAANREADPEFADLLECVRDEDIQIECLRCKVDKDGMKPDKMIPVMFE